MLDLWSAAPYFFNFFLIFFLCFEKKSILALGDIHFLSKTVVKLGINSEADAEKIPGGARRN